MLVLHLFYLLCNEENLNKESDRLIGSVAAVIDNFLEKLVECI